MNNHYSVEVNAGHVADERKLVALIQKGLRDYERRNGNLGFGQSLLRDLRMRRR
ncbi:MAG: hypothetical protein M3O70_16455 [Actinomycetota bacterium]|nr:hypothetical protein [Actinomycetota bacterium]